MDRREALRLLATWAALPLATPKLFAILRDARAVLETQVAHGTLSPHQNVTVTAIAEMIIPKSETPGAADVGVTAFIDLILTEWYTHEERARFLTGLADVDARSQRLFNEDFVECSPNQRAEILTALGARMINDADSIKSQLEAEAGSEPGKNFYYMIRGLILTGYYTSEAGATSELNYQIIPDRYDACADVRAGKEAAERR
jgi:gluconate 2-dehydrogenase gamma chain